MPIWIPFDSGIDRRVRLPLLPRSALLRIFAKNPIALSSATMKRSFTSGLKNMSRNFFGGFKSWWQPENGILSAAGICSPTAICPPEKVFYDKFAWDGNISAVISKPSPV